jgi:hypothetical protein
VQVSIKNGGGIRAAIGAVVAPAGDGETYSYTPPAANPLSGKKAGWISQLDIENCPQVQQQADPA